MWILDNVNAFQELTPEVLASPAHLFTTEPAEMIRYVRTKAHAGDMVFRGENPPDGAIIDYYLREAADSGEVTITIHDTSGTEINQIEPKLEAGINRVVWNLRHEHLPARPSEDDDEDEDDARGPAGPRVVPGTYTVRLQADGRTFEQPVEVREDPRLEIPADERRAWTETLLEIGDLYRAAVAEAEMLHPLAARLEVSDDTARIEDAPAQAAAMMPTDSVAEEAADVADPDPAAGEATAADLPPLSDADAAEVRAVNEDVAEVLSRIGRLYFDVSAWTGPLTANQRSQLEFYRTKVNELQPRVRTISERVGNAER